MVRLLIAAVLPIALLAGCGTAPSTLAVVQAQAAAAVGDLQMIGAVLAARGSVDPATELRLMATVATANEQFQSVQPGGDAAISSAAALLASALTEMQAALPALPATGAALLDAASAALAAYAGSGLPA